MARTLKSVIMRHERELQILRKMLDRCGGHNSVIEATIRDTEREKQSVMDEKRARDKRRFAWLLKKQDRQCRKNAKALSITKNHSSAD